MAQRPWATLGRRLGAPVTRIVRAVPRQRVMQVSWIVVLLAVSESLIVSLAPDSLFLMFYSLCAVAALISVALFGIRLAEDHSPRAAPWLLAAPAACYLALGLLVPGDLPSLYLTFVFSALTCVVYFPNALAWLNNAILSLCMLLIYWHASASLIDAIPQIASIFTLTLLIEQEREHESELMREVATRAAEADALTTISWSLTSLTPDQADIQAILARACPPDVSLAFMRYANDGKTLTTLAAVGDEAEAMFRWAYVMRPDSTSMVAVALRQREHLAATSAGKTAGLLVGGALPSSLLPIRSAAVLPIMAQASEPLALLLAISPSPDRLSRLDRLGMLPAVANQLATALENARLFTEAQARADHDAMTGLYHHRALHNRLGEEIVRSKRTTSPFAVLMMDLDRFKLFNETYGHQIGDKIIVHTAQVLRQTLRSSDLLGRYGGDEFLAILPDTEITEARQIAQSLVESIVASLFRPREDAERMPLTLAVGIAAFPRDGDTLLDLIASAEAAMNDAKHDGGNCWRVAKSSEEPIAGRVVDLRSFGVLEALVTAVDHKDRYTKEHSEEVGTFARLLAQEIALPPSRVALLYDAGLLHDVGKVGVPDAVLRKPGRLTDAEYDTMRQHVVLSEALLRCLLPPETDPDLIEAVRHHHERWDGRGYPRSLCGEEVPLIGRVMIVADAVSAMHMDRPYRKGLSPAQIVAELRRGSGTQFDPALVEPFIATFLRYYDIAASEMVTEPPMPPLAQSVERMITLGQPEVSAA